MNNLLQNTVFFHLLVQSHKEGGSAEEEEEPDAVHLKVERLEEAEPTGSLSIQEGEWNATGHLAALQQRVAENK